MLKRNTALEHLQGSYLFVEVDRHKRAYLQTHPETQLINLGIGDTTQPLPRVLTDAMQVAVGHLGDPSTYSGYGPPFGSMPLREAIASVWYKEGVRADEVYVSDGAKCDISRLQLLFPAEALVAVQDPAYPAYISSSVIYGKSCLYLPCEERRGFFPDFAAAPSFDLLFFCSPNNPTGAVATRAQLEELVRLAHAKKFVILFDAAYAAYIRDAALPRSIYEIEGSKEVAIEIGSFSKMIGLSGVRLGWSVVPKELKFADAKPAYLDWEQIIASCFNGASVIVQKGGVALLREPGMASMHAMTRYYLDNASILKTALVECGLKCIGGEHSPYLWVGFPGKQSWDIFHYLLNEIQLVTIPGSGFGAAGEGYIRISALGNRKDVEAAGERLKRLKMI